VRVCTSGTLARVGDATDPVSLGVILASVRPHRRGEAFAHWTLAQLAGRPGLTAELIDLRDWPLPAFEHPASALVSEKTYPEDSLSRRWGDTIAAHDGFVIVTPEYNHGYPGHLKNAIDQLYQPWSYKPVAFVGYGGVSSGSRAVQQLRQIIVELRMIPVRDEVLLRLIGLAVDERGWPTDDLYVKRLDALATELGWWARMAKDIRARRPR
jgi:NAD(P)H-dependent FMN reductase